MLELAPVLGWEEGIVERLSIFAGMGCWILLAGGRVAGCGLLFGRVLMRGGFVKTGRGARFEGDLKADRGLRGVIVRAGSRGVVAQLGRVLVAAVLGVRFLRRGWRVSWW